MDYTKNVPYYWENHVVEKIKRIRDLQVKGGKESVSVGMITDVHCRCNEFASAPLLDRVLTDCNIPYYFDGGDCVSGCGLCDEQWLIDELQLLRRTYKNVEHKCLLAQGNHDMAYSTLGAPNYYKQNLPFNLFYEHYFRFETQYKDRVFSKNGTYYYADSVFHKTRFVVLNSQDVPSYEPLPDKTAKYNSMSHFGFLQEQMDWFVNVALQVPDKDWNVIVCSHVHISYKKEADHEKVYNMDVMRGIVDAFRKHTTYQGESHNEDSAFDVKVDVDFTGKGGNFVAWLGGHTHRDVILDCGGIVCVETTTDSKQNKEMNKIDTFMYSEHAQAFDVFTISPNEKKVYITRIGIGENREFTYETF